MQAKMKSENILLPPSLFHELPCRPAIQALLELGGLAGAERHVSKEVLPPRCS